jgi:WD40 repeat protein
MTAPPASSSPFPRPIVFGDPKLRADDDLLALVFAPGDTLWSLEEPGILRQWSTVTGHHLQSHVLSDLETLWCFSSSARLLASASDELSLWEVASGNLLASIPQKSWVTALAFSQDDAILATGHDDGVVCCWSLRSRRRIADYHLHKRAVGALAFRADGWQLASAGEEKVIQLWDLKENRPAGSLAGHTDRVPAITWHPRENRLVSAGWDCTARIWDTDTLEPVFLLNDHSTQVNALAFSSDGTVLASADCADTIHLWSFAENRAVRVLKGDFRDIRCLAFHPEGNCLGAGGADHLIHLWNPRSGERLLAGAGGRIRAGVAVSPDGARLVSVGDNLDLCLWDAVRAQPLKDNTLSQAGLANTVAYSPDGRWVAAGGDDTLVRLWDTTAGSEPCFLEGQEDPVTCLAFSPNSQLLASGSSTGGAVWLWSVALREPVLLIPDALDGCTVESLAFHPAGRLLAAAGIDWLSTGGSDGAACLWDIVDRCEVATFPGGATCLAIHPCGRWLATASLVHTICLWDVEDHRLVAEISGSDERINGLAFSPDGCWLAGGGDDRTIRLWSFAEGQPSANPACEVPLETQVKSLCYAPDGRSLFTANGNTTCFRLQIKLPG